MTGRERRIIKSINKEEWIKLLLNNKTDWAANLILYDLYKKNAVVFNTVIKSRKDWINVSKDTDVSYWKEFIR